VHGHCKNGGHFVLDYFNTNWVRENIKDTEIIHVNGIQYEISRTIELDRVIKRIKVGTQLYREDVALFDINDFMRLFKLSGFEIENIYGDYNMNEFDKDSSQRCIIFARKL
jgi:hypothetical protein